MLTEAQLRAIMPNLPASKAALFLPHLNEAMAQYGIDSMMRTAAFVAQLAHESGEFRWMEEIWGPTPAQRRYEPVTDLSQRLGNTEPGDGKRFKGRGPIQLTGRANYRRFGDLLGIDLMAAPEQAAAPEAAFRVAALYWKSRGLNELSDAENFREITRRINGGFNGLADRQKYFERAKAVLATAFQAGGPPATRGLTAPAARELPAEPLTRGFEAIRELAPRKKPGKKAAGRKAPAEKPVTKAVTKKAKTKRASKGTGKKPAKAPARKPSGKKPAAARKAAPKRAAARKPTARPAAKKPTASKPATQKPRAQKAATTKRAAISRAPARRR
jgi:predicted chitinase